MFKELGGLNSWNLKKVSKIEEQAQKRSLLPTLGIELEVPVTFNFKELGQNCINIRLKQLTGYPGSGIYHEFRTPPSYSVCAQVGFLTGLMDLGFIPFENGSNDKPLSEQAVINQGLYSLHCNIGIFSDISSKVSLQPSSVAYSSMINNAKLLARAAGLGFSSPDRIKRRKTRIEVKIQTDVSETTKTTSVNSGRIEYRMGGFGNIYCLRNLQVLQVLSACLLSNARNNIPEICGGNPILDQIWQDFCSGFQPILSNLDESDINKIFISNSKDETEEGFKKCSEQGIPEKLRYLLESSYRQAILIIHQS